MEGWHEEVRVLDEKSPTTDIWADAVARSSGRSVSRLHLTRRHAGAIVMSSAIVAAGLAVGLGLIGNGHSRTSSTQGLGGSGKVKGSGPGAPQVGGVLGVNPYGADGRTVTLSKLVADTSYSLPLPNSPSANSSNVGNVWEDGATHAGTIYYPSSGIQVSYGGTGVDFTGSPDSDIQVIGGIKSLVIPADGMDKLTRVLVPLPGGHLVTLDGAGSVNELKAVAASIVSNSSG